MNDFLGFGNERLVGIARGMKNILLSKRRWAWIYIHPLPEGLAGILPKSSRHLCASPCPTPGMLSSKGATSMN